MKKSLLSLGIAMSLSGFSAVHADNINPKAQTLINTVTQNQVKVTESFKAVDGLTGYVVEPKEGGRSMIVYSSKNNDHLFIGNIITDKGENLTQVYSKKYIESKIAKKAAEAVKTTHWFAEGSDKAPHKAYIVIDPNCVYCHLMYQELIDSKLIDDGKLQVRWIPVGFLRPDSAPKAAAILAAKDPVKLFRQDAEKFKAKKKDGGVEALSKNKENEKFFKEIKENTEFFSKMGFGGTPTIIFTDTTGKPSFVPGFVRGEQLNALVNTMTNKW